MRQLPPNSPEYVIEGPLSGFVSDEGTFTMESEREFKDWLNDHLLALLRKARRRICAAASLNWRNEYEKDPINHVDARLREQSYFSNHSRRVLRTAYQDGRRSYPHVSGATVARARGPM
jgi:hypothetical protein